MRKFAERFPMGLSVAGPHALLSLFSICVALGEPPLSQRALISREAGVAGLELMSFLFQAMEPSTCELNPIGILETMSRTNRIAFCPLIYGYVNYAAPNDPSCYPVKFVNAPLIPQIGRPGSTLGGAGIGISGRTKISEGLIAYLTWLVSEQTQVEFLTVFDGQPSLLPAWIDPGVNRCWNDFYQDTAETVKQAWVRPRYPGYIGFQNEGSEILRQSLCDRISAPEILQKLEDCFNHHHPHDREV
jgi:multiple sugar transport system substrate-binding protein